MNSRLKLYDTLIYTYLEKSDKSKFKKIAYKNKMTISEFNRYLIKLIIKIDESNKLNNQSKLNEKDIVFLLNNLWRDIK